MYDTNADDGRNADDYPRESSPSTGAEELTDVMGVEYGLGTPECDAPECDRAGEPVVVVTPEHARESVRCSTHAKEFLEVST